MSNPADESQPYEAWLERAEKLSAIVEAMRTPNRPTPVAHEGTDSAGTVMMAVETLRERPGRLTPSQQFAEMETMLITAADMVENWIAVREAVLECVLPELDHLSDRRVGELAGLSGQAIRRRRDQTMVTPRPGRPQSDQQSTF